MSSSADSAPALDALGPAPRAELLHVLMLPDVERVGAIQFYFENTATRNFGELLIVCEEIGRCVLCWSAFAGDGVVAGLASAHTLDQS